MSVGETARRAARIAEGRESVVLYEVYPRSFQASGDGPEGDLAGVRARLDHVADLGVDGLWLTPFYPSPHEDGGYDVADHAAVHPAMGDLDAFDALTAEAHGRGLAVLVDLVFNHTSERSDWFRRAVADEPPYRDFYVMAEARPDGSPPTNWLSFFGKPGWRWIPQRERYVLTQFLEAQPCLELRNPDVQAALAEVVRFWRGRGADGFRLDAVASYLRSTELRDNPAAAPETVEASAAGPRNPYARQDHVNDMLPGDGAAYMRHVRDWAGEDAFLIGEINSGNKSLELARSFTEPGRLDGAYTVDLSETPPSPAHIASLFDRLEGAFSGMVWTMAGHDHARAASRAGDGSARDARLLLTLLLTLPGHAILYQGEELGLTQPDLDPDALRDPYDRMYFPHHAGRDGARVPMPWEADAPAYGFTRGAPWLPQPKDWRALAVDRQRGDAGSTLAFARRLIALRKARPALHGVKGEVVEVDGDYLAIRRGSAAEAMMVEFNFGGAPLDRPVSGELLLATAEDESSGTLPARAARITTAG